MLFVAEEVITASGRTRKCFGLEHRGVEPDIAQFARVITSGYFPRGGIGVNDEIARVLEEGESVWTHACTYSAHPVGCAVALANIDILQQENVPAQAAQKGSWLLEKLRAGLSDHPCVGDVRGKGLLCAVERVQVRDTKAELPSEEKVGIKVYVATRSRGLFSRLRGDVFSLAPPVVTTHQQLNRIGEIMAESVEEVSGSR